MLPKDNRLRNTKDIERIFKKGAGLKEGFLFFKIIKNDLDISRFAFIVSQKVSKKAVRRNKIKRWLREIIRLAMPRIKTGFDAVVVAQKGIENEGLKEIKKDAETLLYKAKLII